MSITPDYEYMVKIRRQLHMYPETGFELPKTLELVRSELEKMDIPYTEQYGKSSIVATLNGEKEHPTIGLRADMDALSITEINDVPYKSRHEGKMHACGHDAHTAILLGTAKALSAAREQIDCRVKFLFQASEEGMSTGARLMVEDGVMDDIDFIIALHMDNKLDAGTAAFITGPSHASNTAFILDFYGKSSHAGQPHRGIDAIAMGVRAYTELQFMMSRTVDPFEPCTLNVGAFQAGNTNNIVPEHCRMLCTLRTYSDALAAETLERVRAIISGIANSTGGRAELTVNKHLPPVINDAELTERMLVSARELLGADKALRIERPNLGAEDFACYLTKKPGSIFRLGSRNEKRGFVNMLHQNNWDIDEAALSTGASLMIKFVTDYNAGEDR